MDMEQMFKSFFCFMQAQSGTTNTFPGPAAGESSTTAKKADQSIPQREVREV